MFWLSFTLEGYFFLPKSLNIVVSFNRYDGKDEDSLTTLRYVKFMEMVTKMLYYNLKTYHQHQDRHITTHCVYTFKCASGNIWI